MSVKVTYTNRIGKRVVLTADSVTVYSDGTYQIDDSIGTMIVYPVDRDSETSIKVEAIDGDTGSSNAELIGARMDAMLARGRN